MESFTQVCQCNSESKASELLQNVSSILRGHTGQWSILLTDSNIQSHTGVLPVAKGLTLTTIMISQLKSTDISV